MRRLQDVDTRMAVTQAELAATRSSIQRDPGLEAARAELQRAASARADAERAAAVAETELNALQSRATTLDRRLYGGSVHNPQELLEMQRELEQLRQRVTEAEDRAVELLDASEHATAAEQATLVALQQAEAKRAEALQPLQGRLEALTHELDTETAEREAVVAALEPRALALYTRVALRRTPAVVGLEGDACGGCHLPISNEERRLVRSGTEIVQCSNCDRVLVP